MCYTLPKIWMGRIQKYWDRIIPSDFPQSTSEFSIKFNSDEIAVAVEKLENEIGTEESIVTDFVPEGNYLTNYIGTYNVSGEAGVLTLLSPKEVSTDNVIALHYNEENNEWENVEDVQVIDGYVWGTLESFSPIAIFEYKRDIQILDSVEGMPSANFVVAGGAPIKVYSDEEGNVFVVGPTGNPVELTSKTYIIGGSIDGTPVESTNISVVGVNNSKIVNKIIGGSFYWDLEKATTVGIVNVTIIDSTIGCLTGSSGAVRTEQVNYNMDNVVTSWIGCGESWSDVYNKDVNNANCSFASLAWVKNVEAKVNNCKLSILFMGGNTGYYYVDNTKFTVSRCEFDYLISGGSNGATKNSLVDVNSDSKIGIYQSVNRGEVVYTEANFVNSTVDNLFVGGDATDTTVTGTTSKIKININNGSGSYHIAHGLEGGKLITIDQAKDIVDTVKVSRNADVLIDDSIKDVLGEKFIVK